MVSLPTGGSWESRGGGVSTDGQEVVDDGVAGHCHELHHVGRERHPQEAQPMWTHGVAFCVDERGGVGTGGLCQLHNKEAKCTLRDGKT